MSEPRSPLHAESHFTPPAQGPNLPSSQLEIRSSISRRTRPTSIHITQPESSGLLLEEASDNIQSNLSPSTLSSSSPQTSPRPVHDDRRPMESPCFVHSHLDKGASLSDWLHNKQSSPTRDADVGVSKSLQRSDSVYSRETSYPRGSTTPPNSTVVEDDVDEDGDFTESLTKQLAETAVGVREMSKQLGQLRLWLTA